MTLNGVHFRGTEAVAGEDDVDEDYDDNDDDNDDASRSSDVVKLRTPADLLGPLRCQQVERVPIVPWPQCP